jgi:hypothetical protein
MKNAQNGKVEELFALVIVLVFVQLWFCPGIHLALLQEAATFSRSLRNCRGEQKLTQIP